MGEGWERGSTFFQDSHRSKNLIGGTVVVSQARPTSTTGSGLWEDVLWDEHILCMSKYFYIESNGGYNVTGLALHGNKRKGDKTNLPNSGTFFWGLTISGFILLIMVVLPLLSRPTHITLACFLLKPSQLASVSNRPMSVCRAKAQLFIMT